MHPYYEVEKQKGVAEALLQPVTDMIRKSVGRFEALLGTLAPHLRRRNPDYKDPIDPEQLLAVRLRRAGVDTATINTLL